MIKNSPEEGTPPLSAFEESILLHIERIKTNYNVAKEQYQIAQDKLTLVKYFEKYHWIARYIKDIEIFHINELYDYVKDAKDISGDRTKKMPDRKTISRYLNLLFKEKLLKHKPIPSNFPNMYKFYWIPQINEEKRKEVLQAIFDSYKEPTRHKKKTKTIEEEDQPHYQAQISQFNQTLRARKDKKEILKQEQEQEELERQKQKELKKQQREIENKEKNERKKAALIKSTKKETVKKNKKTKNGSRILTEEELKANFKRNQKEIEITREEKEYQAVKEKITREKTVSEEGG